MASLSGTNPSLFIRLSFYWVGLWPSERPSLLYRCFANAFLAIFFLFYTSFKVIYAFTTTKMEEIVFCSFVSLTEVALCVKLLNMRYRMAIFQQHLNEMHAFKLESQEEVKLIDGRCRILTKMLFAYIGLVMVTGVFSYLVPFFLDEPTLPYLAWYPLDWYHSRPIYWTVYAYQVTGMIIQSHTLVCMEMYMVYLFVILSTQFDILSMRLKKIGWNGLDDKAANIEQMSTAAEIIQHRRRANAGFIDCIKAHRTISGYVEAIINSISRPFQFMSSMIFYV